MEGSGVDTHRLPYQCLSHLLLGFQFIGMKRKSVVLKPTDRK